MVSYRSEAAAQTSALQRRLMEVESQAMATVHEARSSEIMFAETGRREPMSEAQPLEREALAYVSAAVENRRSELESAARKHEDQARESCERGHAEIDDQAGSFRDTETGNRNCSQDEGPDIKTKPAH